MNGISKSESNDDGYNADVSDDRNRNDSVISVCSIVDSDGERNVVPEDPYREDAEHEDIRRHICCGALCSEPDPRDWVFEKLTRSPGGRYLLELPPEYHLREYEQPAREQGQRGTCAAMSGAAIIEIKYKMHNKGRTKRMSPEFIYYHRNNKPASGMFGKNVFQVLKEHGTVPEQDYPYCDADNVAPAPSKRIMQIAAKYRIEGYARISTIEGLKRALIELGPCYISLPLYETRPYFWRPGKATPDGHAMVVVGYNREGFILRNSWGDKWNGDGHIVFPYNEWPCHLECWTCIDNCEAKSRKKDNCTIC